jgi:phage gp36-like protein
MPTPYVSGDASIGNRWLNGSATVLWIGDSIGVGFESRLMHVLRVNPPGLGVRGGGYGAIGAPSWAATGSGALGATGLLTEKNYSPFPAQEAVFNGGAVPATGVPAAINSRLLSSAGESLLLGGRSGLTFGGVDWIAGSSLRMRCVLYCNSSSSNGIVRNYLRGSGSSSVARGTGSFLNLHAAAPSYVTDDIPFTAPAAGEDLYLEAQSFEGATPTNGTNFILCCALITTGQPGFTFIPASNGGWDVLKWTNPAIISDAALAGVLPPLGITDVVISLGQNNPSVQTAAQFQASLGQLVARLRAALPAASIVFLPTYDTNNAGSSPHQAGFTDAHYAAQQATPNSCFLNLYKAAGIWSQNNALGLFTDGVHPSDPGRVYFLQTIQGLLDMLIADIRATASGRYAIQRDVEDLFGRANIAAWAQLDSSGAIDIARIQRALDFADATIDDYFRDGLYTCPLLLGASKPTVAAWAATIAGVRLYRSRTTIAAGSGSGAAVNASVTISAGAAVSASVTQPADPYTAMLADVRAQMARCKAGAWRLDAAGTTALAAAVVE